MKSFLIHLFRTRLCTPKNLLAFKPCMFFIHPSASVTISKKFRFNEQWDVERIIHNKVVGQLYVAKNASLNVGSFVVRPGCRIDVNPGARLVLGSGSINYDCVIDSFNSITVGNGVVISEQVIIRDSDNHTIKGGNTVSAPIVIQDNVWVGMGVTILKGVTIGTGAVIAAGSIVTKDIPAHCLAAGVPARVVKTEISWER